jgi:hypothetical protein
MGDGDSGGSGADYTQVRTEGLLRLDREKVTNH